MGESLIYIDGDQIHAGKSFLSAVRKQFSPCAKIEVFKTGHWDTPEDRLSKCCESEGVKLFRVQSKIDLHECADIQMYASIYGDLLQYSDPERKNLTVVIASGDSDFYRIAKALKTFVKVVVCGPKATQPLLKTVARYISCDMLRGKHIPEPLSQARSYIESVLHMKLQGDDILTIDELEKYLIDADFAYFPLLYGPYYTTSQLLEALGVSVVWPAPVHSIRQHLKYDMSKPDVVSKVKARPSKTPRQRQNNPISPYLSTFQNDDVNHIATQSEQLVECVDDNLSISSCDNSPNMYISPKSIVMPHKKVQSTHGSVSYPSYSQQNNPFAPKRQL
ncbi:hypothetical protein GEMRC1_011050 [Eukaryota sp. GEM-RC1]